MALCPSHSAAEAPASRVRALGHPSSGRVFCRAAADGAARGPLLSFPAADTAGNREGAVMSGQPPQAQHRAQMPAAAQADHDASPAAGTGLPQAPGLPGSVWPRLLSSRHLPRPSRECLQRAASEVGCRPGRRTRTTALTGRIPPHTDGRLGRMCRPRTLAQRQRSRPAQPKVAACKAQPALGLPVVQQRDITGSAAAKRLHRVSFRLPGVITGLRRAQRPSGWLS